MYPGMNYPTNAPVMTTAQMPGGMNYPMNNQSSNVQMPGSMNYPTSTPVSSSQMQSSNCNYHMNTPVTSSQMQGNLGCHNNNDPVTNAVLNNIHSTMKKSTVRCNDCNLDFTSQVVLDAHLQGSRHAKQMKSKNILATLEQTNVAFSKDQDTNGLKCNVCNVFLNSIQQLQTHLNGNRHKKKMSKGMNVAFKLIYYHIKALAMVIYR